jgi:protein-L-isoaspartate(D-aspartate) O-methyltransferase
MPTTPTAAAPGGAPDGSPAADPAGLHAAARQRMLDAVAAGFARTAGQTGLAAPGPALSAALAAVPRHRFVPAAWQDQAYADRPLPIGHGQTISQPFIVALMTALLEAEPGQRVLEIGTGCGYQAAVLAALGLQVTSVEVVPGLAARARRTHAALGVQGVEVHTADGRQGWPAGAPYDAVIATAAGCTLPPAWGEQLAPGGRIVAPLGPSDETQVLTRWRKGPTGALAREDLLGVRFVPLVGG